MKKLLFLSLYFSVAHFSLAVAQCNAEELSRKSIARLSTGFNFLKNYKIEAGTKPGKVEYSYVFTKGTQYMITLCEDHEPANTITVTIFDARRNRVASNRVNGDAVPAIAYPCNATGIYYLQYTFEAGSAGCGGSALGFRK